MQTFTVNGDFQRSFGRKGSRQGELEHPCGVALDRLGNVLVSEFTNSRVQVRNEGESERCEFCDEQISSDICMSITESA